MAGKIKFPYNLQPIDLRQIQRQIQGITFLQEPPTVLMFMPYQRNNHPSLTIGRPQVFQESSLAYQSPPGGLPFDFTSPNPQSITILHSPSAALSAQHRSCPCAFIKSSFCTKDVRKNSFLDFGSRPHEPHYQPQNLINYCLVKSLILKINLPDSLSYKPNHLKQDRCGVEQRKVFQKGKLSFYLFLFWL